MERSDPAAADRSSLTPIESSQPGMNFPVTRDHALARWREFVPLAQRYSTWRSHVLPNHPYVSRMSPAIARRLVSEDELLAILLARYPLKDAEKLVEEIHWRRYWKGWLELRPAVWLSYTKRVRQLSRRTAPDTLDRIAAVEAGKSGVAIMDHFVRELTETGYLHNHSRMWLASFWVHIERLPWELGADFFLRHLLDADAASNTLSWRWVAGIQTLGKAYLVRRSNLERYCDNSLLGDRTGLERLEDSSAQVQVIEDHAETVPRSTERAMGLPAQIDEPYGIWIHPDDLSVEQSELGKLRPIAVAAFLSHHITAGFNISAKRRLALETGLTDAVARAKLHFDCPATLEPAHDTHLALLDWARKHELAAIVTAKPFVGPVWDELPAIKNTLSAAGIRLVLARRRSDANLVPAAKRGFYDFWQRVQRQLPGAQG